MRMSWLPVVFFLCLTACSSTRTAYPDAGKSKDAALYTESSVPDTPPTPDRESAKDEGPDTDTVVESPAHRECKLTFSYDTLGEAGESLTLPGEFKERLLIWQMAISHSLPPHSTSSVDA